MQTDRRRKTIVEGWRDQADWAIVGLGFVVSFYAAAFFIFTH